MFRKPVIILGAPRSGTSLLMKIIREHPSFASVPRESDVIWNTYCHPSLNNWDAEGIDSQRIDSEMVDKIRNIFEQSALSASTWQRWSELGGFKLMKHPISSAIIRKAYHPAFALLTVLRKTMPRHDSQKSHRLVDKSVHCPLWLNLVDAVFPDALYIHITRNGLYSVDSMLDGWLLDSKRFNTYRLPELNIQGYEGTDWNFALPYGWRDYVNQPLENVVSFQWITIQEAILKHLDTPALQQRNIQIKLENLTHYPIETLKQLAEFIQVSNEFSQYEQDMPIINASSTKRDTANLRYPEKIANISTLLEPLQKRLGYE
ncbi:sulfotransferase [Candidatus Albibeggiatoa sp. nov. BB20]|uniref:sulfotransferase n=1 Tax=Candidatus Albibeggiatoa sp. nov. BB20 TaxID=3162723 RepID=UPI0033658889